MKPHLVAFTLRGQRHALVLCALGLWVSGTLLGLLSPASLLASTGSGLAATAHPPGLAGPGSLAGWLSNQSSETIWAILLSAFTVVSGSATVARELETGTLALLLATPVSRQTILFSKLAALAIALAILILATVAGLATGAALAGGSLPLSRLVGAGVLSFAFFFTVGAYSALLSTLANDRTTALGLAAGITAAFYLAHLVADAWPLARPLRYASLFSFYRPFELLASGAMPWLDMMVLLAQAAAYLLLAASIIRERDFAI